MPDRGKGSRLEGVTVVFDGRAIALRVFLALIAAEILLVALDVLLNRSGIVPHRAFRRLFNIAFDNGIAGWFASAQSLLAALCAGGTALVRRRRGHVREAAGWLFVALLFLYLAADDAAKIHERIGTTFDKIAAAGGPSFLGRWPSYTWQVTVGPLLLAAGLATVVFLWGRLGEYGWRRFLVAGFGCLGAAVAIDVAEGLKGAYRDLALATGLRYSFVAHYLRALEEFLEMAGTSVFLALFLAILLENLDGLTFRTRPLP